ncbi:MAG: L,D-transpeptidase family protein, partial [Kiritimatiellales bacterium]
DDAQATQLFERAQQLAGAGRLQDASDLLGRVISSASDESLRNNALRVQGRINVQLFLSPAPTPEKKRYVIQPGDSLDRIARQNKTTVDLLRRMNNIEGNLIYPGATLMVPAAPFEIYVHKSAKLLDLMMNGRLFKRYAVGLGRYGKTPLGTFKTVVHQMNPDWTPPSGGIIPFGDPRNVLGTRWMSIQDASRPDIKGFGIHGTSERDSIGGETSNGCVRMLNEDVEELYMLIPRGTEVTISE